MDSRALGGDRPKRHPDLQWTSLGSAPPLLASAALPHPLKLYAEVCLSGRAGISQFLSFSVVLGNRLLLLTVVQVQ